MDKQQRDARLPGGDSGAAANVDMAIAREFESYLDSIASAYTGPLARAVQQREREFQLRLEATMSTVKALNKAMREQASMHAQFLANATKEREESFHRRAEAAMDGVQRLQESLEQQAEVQRAQVTSVLAEQQQVYRESLEAILKDTALRIDLVTRTAMKRRFTWVTIACWILALGQLGLLAAWFFSLGK